MNGRMTRGGGIVAIAVVCMGSGTGCALFGTKVPDQVITMDELPPAVRPWAENEVVGGEIQEVEKEMMHGKVIYAITYFDQTGTLMEIEYAEDGTLISKGRE